jgi:hypothetical protein
MGGGDLTPGAIGGQDCYGSRFLGLADGADSR